MTVSTDPEQFALCLVGFQARDPQSFEQYEKSLRPYLVSLARKIARQLSDDLQEEVVQQVCLDLIGDTYIRFDPMRGSAKGFLVFAIRNAVRKVRADYCPPGCRTRPKKSDGSWEYGYPPLSIEALDNELGTRTTEHQITAKCEANSLLERAPERVVIALKRIHYLGDSLGEVAQDLDVSRFKLSREMSAYCLRMQNVHRTIVTACQYVC